MLQTDPVLVLDKAPLRVRYLMGTGDTLVVSFSGVGRQRSNEPPIEFPGIASENGKNHVLFVTDQSRSWLNGPDIAPLLTRCIDAVATEIGAKRVVGLGNSMGASMALLLSNAVAFDAVLAMTPQYSVVPEEVPEETRWSYFRKRIKTFRYPRIDTFRADRTKYFILHGGDETELIHALRFPMTDGVAHMILPDSDHVLARDLKRKGVLAPVVQDVINGRYRRMRGHLAELGMVRRIEFEERLRQAEASSVAA